MPERTADRSAATGRDVPLNIVRDIFVQLNTAVPVYLNRQPELASAVLVYHNDDSNVRRRHQIGTSRLRVSPIAAPFPPFSA